MFRREPGAAERSTAAYCCWRCPASRACCCLPIAANRLSALFPAGQRVHPTLRGTRGSIALSWQTAISAWAFSIPSCSPRCAYPRYWRFPSAVALRSAPWHCAARVTRRLANAHAAAQRGGDRRLSKIPARRCARRAFRYLSGNTPGFRRWSFWRRSRACPASCTKPQRWTEQGARHVSFALRCPPSPGTVGFVAVLAAAYNCACFGKPICCTAIIPSTARTCSQHYMNNHFARLEYPVLTAAALLFFGALLAPLPWARSSGKGGARYEENTIVKGWGRADRRAVSPATGHDRAFIVYERQGSRQDLRGRSRVLSIPRKRRFPATGRLLFASQAYLATFWNSLGIALCATALNAVVSLVAGYALAHARFPGRGC